MLVYKLPECELIPELPRGCSVALGNFDGVHRGHQQLFRLASDGGHKTAAWTFTELAKPGLTVPYITEMKTKLALFAELGLDYAVFEDFDKVRDIPHKEFALKYICEQLRPQKVACGFNFRFGSRGLGDAELLRQLLVPMGIEVAVLQPVIRHNKIVSSSLVRAAVSAGDMDEAFDLLGHPFSINFPVVEGKQLGRTIGIPTINQDFPAGHIIPRFGIYACTVKVGKDTFLGVANVGVRPTVSHGSTHVNCETHIIDFSGILYGNEILVSFYRLLRDEQCFDTVESLSRQIKCDIEETRRFFANLYGG